MTGRFHFRRREEATLRFKQRGQQVNPNGVARGFHMQQVIAKQFGTRFTVGAEHRGINIEKRDQRIMRARVGDERIGMLCVFVLVPAGRAGFQGNEDQAALGEGGMQFEPKIVEVRRHFFRGNAGMNIVFTSVEHHGVRLIGTHDAVKIKDAVGKFRAAEAAADHRKSGKVLLKAGPEPDRGTADENDPVLRWRVLRVGLRQRIDLCFPVGRIGVRAGNKETKEKAQQKGAESGS